MILEVSYTLAEVVTGTLAQRGYTPALCARTIGGVSESDYVEMLLDHQVSGIIFAGGSYALAGASHDHCRRLTDRGLPVVLVNAGVDDSAFMTCTDPPLTTVRQPIETMGQAAVDLLVTQIDGAGVLRDELLFEPELVVRGSTSPATRHRPR
ncbi:DNA-binding transcriptional regulator CytR [Micromonospora sp. MW-13]|nr:DNA-binding transcriptional regulator CytR [Micromonospora sp. MW-13]